MPQGLKGARADGLAKRGNHVTDAVMFQLLRGRALLVDIVAPAGAERCIHLAGVAGILNEDRDGIDALLQTGIAEHRHRLPAMIDQHAFAGEFGPDKIRVGLARGEKEAVLFVDLGKMAHGGPQRPLRQAC